VARYPAALQKQRAGSGRQIPTHASRSRIREDDPRSAPLEALARKAQKSIRAAAAAGRHKSFRDRLY
jgi:hypothetical protein